MLALIAQSCVMSITKFLNHLRLLDIRIWLEDNQLYSDAPKGVMTPELQAKIKENKAEILAFLRQSQTTSQTISKIEPVNLKANIPLSFAQQRLWFLSQLEPGSHAYNVPIKVRLKGKLDVACLEKAFCEIVRRHEVLRTTFPFVDGKPIQVIEPSRHIVALRVDLSRLPPAMREVETSRIANLEVQRAFDLSKGQLWNLQLIQHDDLTHDFLLTMHHIIVDGWSVNILFDEISALYTAYKEGKPSPLPKLPIQYSDYAVWQRQWLQGNIRKNYLDYWKNQLTDAPTLLELPTDKPRTPLQSFQSHSHTFDISGTLLQHIQTFCHSEEVTAFMFFLAAFKVLIYRYSRQSDIVIGVPSAGRTRIETEKLIGFFVNTLVLRSNVLKTRTFRQLLHQVRHITQEAFAHQEFPFNELVEVLQPKRSSSHTPLFQVMFVMQNTPQLQKQLPGLQIETVDPPEVAAKFDITLILSMEDKRVRAKFEYNSFLFSKTTISHMAENFQILLTAIVTNLDEEIDSLQLISSKIRQKMLVDWNQTASPYAPTIFFYQLFENQAVKRPDAIALVFEDQQITYGEVNRRSNQLAHYLQNNGVGPNTIVGLALDRSIDMVIGLMSILKAGGAYLPLDLAYPKERLTFILADTNAPILLTHYHLNSIIKPMLSGDQFVVNLDADWPMIALESISAPNNRIEPENLAYVIYTSGTTGKPKGVLLHHQGLCNLAFAQSMFFDIQTNDRILQFSSISFDAAIFEIVMALANGATLCMRQPEGLLPGPHLFQSLAELEITIVTLVPSVLALLPAGQLPALRILNVAGEACSIELASKWNKNRSFFNLYGPTEATVWTSGAEYTEKLKQLTIGRPIPNVQVFVLDTHQQLVPIGVPGELYISGDGLAHGYINRPALTAEKFIPNPFAINQKDNQLMEPQNQRLYKTGDIVRYSPDGTLVFEGRVDDQIKLRGFRIELGEVESVLQEHSRIARCVVVLNEESSDDQRLVAYVVGTPKETVDTVELQSFAKNKLPNYMVPTSFITLDKLPLTISGKVDRQMLAQTIRARPQTKTSTLPIGDILAWQLSRSWEDVLNRSPIGYDDNFFEIGGHSLLAARLLSRVQQEFGINIPLSTFYYEPTLRRMVTFLQEDPKRKIELPLVAIKPSGNRLPFYCMHALSGNLFPYIELASHLDSDQPVYGFRLPEQTTDQITDFRIEVIAANYIKALKHFQDQGPYILGGWSFGGVIAFEMACQLKAAGDQVGQLVLMDSQASFYFNRQQLIDIDESALFTDLMLSSQFRFGLSPEELIDIARDIKVNEGEVNTLELIKDGNSHLAQEVYGLIRNCKANLQALVKYQPGYYSGATIIYRAQDKEGEQAHDLTLGWSEHVSEKVRVYEVPGDHYTMMTKPYVGILANKISTELEVLTRGTAE